MVKTTDPLSLIPITEEAGNRQQELKLNLLTALIEELKERTNESKEIHRSDIIDLCSTFLSTRMTFYANVATLDSFQKADITVKKEHYKKEVQKSSKKPKLESTKE